MLRYFEYFCIDLVTLSYENNPLSGARDCLFIYLYFFRTTNKVGLIIRFDNIFSTTVIVNKQFAICIIVYNSLTQFQNNLQFLI